MSLSRLPGFDLDTDRVERANDFSAYPFVVSSSLIRVTRRFGANGPVPLRDIGLVAALGHLSTKLVAVLPLLSLTDPWPQEFLWKPIKLLGVVPAWHSVYRSTSVPSMFECVYETADRYRGSSMVSPELMSDEGAYHIARRQILHDFLSAYQDALDKGNEFTRSEPAG